jgi:zinc transport system substrate-binding protein
MVKLSDADILVINGDGMENFIDKAISTYKDLRIINASEGIKDNHEELLSHEHEEDDEHHEHHEHGINSHYWVSISLFIEQVKNIEKELCKLDEKNASKYIENANNYTLKLEELKKKMHNSLDNISNKNIVVFHEAFDYFAEEFDLNIVSVIEREPGTYPSSRDVASIIDEVKNNDVNAIFTEPQYSKTAADTIARETNVKVFELDPIVTGDLNKDAYIKTMEKNLDVLKNALKQMEVD